ncbi:hypothetical protein LWI29_005604 [Acer saccharum]|uniref:DUF4219 domain-containing protein n=1 Tax=Acer saccharum TaxID=4024 RepID=A0AA39V8M1_ACESA|nr:hypothetical protein LWI29_005604 [Acer saccharum]
MSGFEMSREGASSIRPPLLHSDNYSSWKGKMEAYLLAIDDKVLMIIEDRYSPPTKTLEDGSIVSKPKSEWSAQNFKASKWNNKAMPAIFYAMDDNQYKLIQITKNAHKAWKILETAHEGTDTVKDSKLQMLQVKLETIKMEEDECFNDFQIKLMDIVNQSHQLGDPYSDMRIKQKIMRSFPKRFELKVSAIEEMMPSEVIRKLLAYEAMKLTSQPKRQKGIVLTLKIMMTLRVMKRMWPNLWHLLTLTSGTTK